MFGKFFSKSTILRKTPHSKHSSFVDTLVAAFVGHISANKVHELDEALESMDSHRVVHRQISDYKMTEMDGLGLLKKLRERDDETPFIILTGKGGEEVAIEALNYGADKYFRKRDDPSTQYEKLAEAIVQEVRKSRTPSGWRVVHEDSLPLLSRMIDGEIGLIRPVIDIQAEEKIKYPDAAELMDVSNREAESNLESLEQEGVLVREFSDKILICPQCGSAELKFSTLCPYCESPDIVKREVIEHLSCGHIDPREDFREKTGEYICPKCGDELEAIGVDYAQPGVFFFCRECGEMSDTPEEIWECQSCSESFETAEADVKAAYSYELNEDRREWLRRQLESESES